MEVFRPLGGANDAQVANAVALLFQAHDASAALVGNTVLAICTQGLGEMLATDMNLLTNVIEEVVRYDSPVQNTRRWVLEDGIVAGQAMRAGDGILLLIAAANRDPQFCAQPERFDPFRKNRHSFTFGDGHTLVPANHWQKQSRALPWNPFYARGSALRGSQTACSTGRR